MKGRLRVLLCTAVLGGLMISAACSSGLASPSQNVSASNGTQQAQPAAEKITKPAASPAKTEVKQKPSVQNPATAKAKERKLIICIDPGHQAKGNNKKEPIGPNSKIMKAKVSSGTAGVATKKPEYVLNLEVALQLEKRLKEKGYTVVMTRRTHNVNISNRERAEVANRAHADLLVRIHADGDTSKSKKGISVLYPSLSNPYTGKIYGQSKRAAEELSTQLMKSTGATSKTTPRDDLTGFNWSTVPAVVVEMGFMTNPEEDRRLSTPAYQKKIVDGLIAGIANYEK